MPSELPDTLARLARSGQQATLIEQAGAALAAGTLPDDERVALLDQRAEALIALGRFEEAARDADTMQALAAGKPVLQVAALMRKALVQMRLSRNRQALGLAEQALALAEMHPEPALQAQAVLCLAESQLRAAHHEAALASAHRAAALFDARGDLSGAARARWLVAFACTRLSRNDESRAAATQAATLARQAGDAYGLANALNVLSFSCTDIAERLQVLRQAAAAFERAGYLFGRMVVLGNLSLTFAELGLWRHAIRLGEQCMAWAEHSGARLNLALEMGAVMVWQVELGDLAGARARWATYDALVDALDEPVTRNDRALWAAELEAAAGRRQAALRQLRAFQRQVRADNPGFELYVLIPLARLLVQAGDAAAALRDTLFKKADRPGYSQLRVAVAEIKSTIFGHAEFTTYNESATKLFAKWKAANTPRLKGIAKGGKPKVLIETLSEDLLATFEKARLLDSYDVYQHLMDFWAETMQDDVYMIFSDGWREAAKPRLIIEDKDKKTKEKPDFTVGKLKYKAELIPTALVIARYFPAEQAAIEKLEAEVAAIEQAMEEMAEEHGGEDGLLAEAKNEKDKLTKASVAARLKEIKGDKEVADERKLLNDYLALSEKEAATSAKLSNAQDTLMAKVAAQYGKLTEDEIKALVVNDKWLAGLATAVQGELDRVSQTLTGRIRQLAERYATPLPQLTDEVAALAARVDGHLKKMGAVWSA